MNIALILQIITAALQLAPLGISTIQGIKELLAQDPAVPAELQALLLSTATDNAATLASVQAWLVAHPEV